MRYSNVYIDALGYVLPVNVITSEDIEDRLEPLYDKLHFPKGQLTALTGIGERRFWDPGYPISAGAVEAGKRVLDQSDVAVNDIGMLIYGGVCRDYLEPATACAVAHSLGLGAHALVYDVSNACLGMLNAMLQVADAIELGHIEAGLVVSCESARNIVDTAIHRMLTSGRMSVFKKTVATLTGGSGAAAVLLAHGSVSNRGHRLIGGTIKNDSTYHQLCTWGSDTGCLSGKLQVMETDSVAVLNHGCTLAVETYAAFKQELNWAVTKPDKIICHQVGAPHQKALLKALNIPGERDFTTFQYLGNMGTVSLPITAAIAEERGFLKKDDLVGLLGIGSGLNCLMLGVRW